jgi:DNA-binding MarR family transcriptional regulator
MIRVLDADLARSMDLSLQQYEILLFLANAPDRSMRMAQLADSVMLSRSGLTRSVDQLVARGLVERRRCPTDARGWLAALTPDGYQTLRDAAPIHLKGIKDHFTSKLEAGELTALAGLLERVNEPAAEVCPQVS